MYNFLFDEIKFFFCRLKNNPLDKTTTFPNIPVWSDYYRPSNDLNGVAAAIRRAVFICWALTRNIGGKKDS
jgi:hypothetical protein